MEPSENENLVHVPFPGEERHNLDLIPSGFGLRPSKTRNISCTRTCKAIPLSVTLLLATSINESSVTDKNAHCTRIILKNKHKLRKQ